MQKLFAVVLLWLIAVPIGSITAEGNDAAASNKQIDAILAAVTKPDEPGLAAVVKKDGHVIFEQGYGVRKLGTAEKIDAETNFRLASVTKELTAVAIMLLVKDGKVRYDERLTEIFPEFPAYGKNITVRNLLNHTGGLPDYEDLMDREEKTTGPRWSAEHQIQDDAVLALLEKQTEGKFAPGTSWTYSNSGYVVLGLIVAKASGMPYRDFLQKRIFDPAGMRHSVVYQKGKNEVGQRAFGNSKHGGSVVETDQSSTSATLGDGGVYSNLQDMVKWDEVLEKHTLLSEADMAPALTPAKLVDGSETHWPGKQDGNNLAPGKPVSYGFGWFLDPLNGHPRMWHAGGTMGFRTVIQRFTKDGLTIIILCNRADFNPDEYSDKIAALLLAP
ncbi:MAG TPA: serine hydrolase domain-containing protein [Candidatus Acidoferrum sp.]|jgi:CubicO group peptidase (beta-lactamase class C family)